MFFVQNTASEDDNYLISCFYDKNYISKIMKENISFISGRKGMGKTALAKVAQKNKDIFGIDYCEYVSLSSDLKSTSDISSQKERDKNIVANEVLVFILIKLVKALLEEDEIEDIYKEFWTHFLEKNGFYEIKKYNRYLEIKDSSKRIIKPEIKTPLGGGSLGEHVSKIIFEEKKINDSVDILWEDFLKSFPKNKIYHIYLDDIDTRIDLDNDPENEALHRLIEKIHCFNREARDEEKQVKIVMCIRDDMWRYITGSNVQKFKSSSLELEWNEKDFIELMGKRIDPEKNPKDAVESIFQDAIFETPSKKIAPKKFHSYFYTYLYSLSFNRARDFLRYGFIATKKISPKTFRIDQKHLTAIENEFCAYIRTELKDEFFLMCQKYDFSMQNLDHFLKKLAHKKDFNISDFRKLKKNTSLKGKVSEYILLKELWKYSVIGEKSNDFPIFQYHNQSKGFSEESQLKKSLNLFVLHPALQKAYKLDIV